MHTRNAGRQDREHGIFDVHVRVKREAGRLREYRSKGVDTHWLSAILCQVNMAHKYRPLQPIEMGEIMSLGAEGKERRLTDILCILLLETEATEMIPTTAKDVSANRYRNLNVPARVLTILDKRRSIS